MGRRKLGGQVDPPAALPPEEAPPVEAVRVVFLRGHWHRGTWYAPGDTLVASLAEVELLRTFAEIKLP